MKHILLIGDPVAHSLSPKLHKVWLDELGVDGSYSARRVVKEELPAILEDIRTGNLAGANVTIPHKEEVCRLLDKRTPAAAATGAVNTIYRDPDGNPVGDNTDAEGFLENLRHAVPEWRAKNKTALILGAGGAARAVVLGLLGESIGKIYLAAREKEKANTLKAAFEASEIHPLSWQEIETVAPGADIVINATPRGLPGYDRLVFEVGLLKKGAVVYDLVYGKEKTPLLKDAFRRGLVTCDGLGMLVFQAIPAFEKWFGIRPKFTEDLLNYLRIED